MPSQTLAGQVVCHCISSFAALLHDVTWKKKEGEDTGTLIEDEIQIQIWLDMNETEGSPQVCEHGCIDAGDVKSVN